MHLRITVTFLLCGLIACSTDNAPGATSPSCWNASPAPNRDDSDVSISAIAITGATGTNWLISESCPYENLKIFIPDNNSPARYRPWREEFLECGSQEAATECHYRVRLTGQFLAKLSEQYTSCYPGPYFRLEAVESYEYLDPGRFREIFDRAEREWEGDIPKYEDRVECTY